MTASQLELLQYAGSVSDGINWYKIHRKYFGDSAYEEINENPTKLLEELVRLGYLSMTAESGQIELYRITEIGLRVINNQE